MMTKLLSPEDPPAVRVHNPDGKASIVISCEHASNTIPKKLANLGLSDAQLKRHIAYDIGAQGIAEILSKRLDAPAVFAGFSRLVIDLNRPVDDFTSIRHISDRTVIPGHAKLTEQDIQQRHDELFWPFHDALEQQINTRQSKEKCPILIAMHSCTDTLYGVKRPWHIGVLSNHDRRIADPILTVLKNNHPELCIGDNKPYSGADPYAFTVESHAVQKGYANVSFEVRQDLIRDRDGIERFGAILADALEAVLGDPELYQAYP